MNLLLEHKHLFLKPIDDMCGNGATCIDFEDGFSINDKIATKDDIESLLNTIRGNFIIQPRLIQHPTISEIYPNAINTLRIVTVNPKQSSKTEDVVLLACLLRLGAHGNFVDNWAKGGVIVRVGTDGLLDEYGFYKTGYGTRTREHPDTKTIFKGIEVPYYKEAITLAKQFHSKIKVHSIGWDVAITTNGPVFIEGNDNWELGFVQICEGNIQEQLEMYF